MANDTDSFYLFNRPQQINDSYFEFEVTLYAHGLCGDLQVSPAQRSCTPPPHLHLYQTELFTVLRGQIRYQLGDKINSCDIRTCPRPLVIPPLTPHTFWMDDDKEDLVIRIRAEPCNMYNGACQKFFENYVGIFRDQHTSIWQIFVLFDYAQTYQTSLPLPLSKIIVKTGALIGQLLGYKVEYEEYTTTADEI